jgi:hypothetical protein
MTLARDHCGFPRRRGYLGVILTLHFASLFLAGRCLRNGVPTRGCLTMWCRGRLRRPCHRYVAEWLSRHPELRTARDRYRWLGENGVGIGILPQ